MSDEKLVDFQKFTRKRLHKFKQISRATKHEYEPEDVQNETWLLATEWELNGTPINFDDPQYTDKLFAFLYNKLVKHSERKIRNSVRLDHGLCGDGIFEIPTANRAGSNPSFIPAPA